MVLSLVLGSPSLKLVGDRYSHGHELRGKFAWAPRKPPRKVVEPPRKVAEGSCGAEIASARGVPGLRQVGDEPRFVVREYGGLGQAQLRTDVPLPTPVSWSHVKMLQCAARVRA